MCSVCVQVCCVVLCLYVCGYIRYYLASLSAPARKAAVYERNAYVCMYILVRSVCIRARARVRCMGACKFKIVASWYSRGRKRGNKQFYPNIYIDT